MVNVNRMLHFDRKPNDVTLHPIDCRLEGSEDLALFYGYTLCYSINAFSYLQIFKYLRILASSEFGIRNKMNVSVNGLTKLHVLIS